LRQSPETPAVFVVTKNKPVSRY